MRERIDPSLELHDRLGYVDEHFFNLTEKQAALLERTDADENLVAEHKGDRGRALPASHRR